MTQESFRSFVRAFAIVTVVVGGFGSALCVPYALTTDLYLIATSGIYFIAGGVMIAGGLIALSIMLQLEK